MGSIDTFTIARTVFLVFIVLVSVYFVIENKRDKGVRHGRVKETFAEPTTTTTAAAAPAPAPKAGSTEFLDGKNKQAQDPKAPLPTASPVYLPKEEAKIKEAITNIYKESYQSTPSSEELKFYTEYAMSRNVTKEQLKEVIETSAPTLQKTFYSQKNANTPDEVFGMENEIIEIYNELLMRNPDRRELYSYAKMMAEDKTFSLDKMRQVLIASEEFKRMEKTQNNKVYVNLQSNITDRQITLQVTRIYIQVTKKEYIDEDTLKFLKRKFVELDLNERALAAFIAAYLSNKPFVNPVQTEADAKNAAEIAAAAAAEEAKRRAAMEQEYEELKKKLMADMATKQGAAPATAKKSGDKESFQDGKNIFNDANLYFFGEGPNKDVLESIKAGAVGKDGRVDTDKLIGNIKGDEEVCKYSKNWAEEDMLSKNKQDLADYINDRNMSHLKNVCRRNKKYINADDNMVLFPEYKWSVPQPRPPVCAGATHTVNPSIDQTALIGTLLPSAADTKVGSILPVFPPV